MSKLDYWGFKNYKSLICLDDITNRAIFNVRMLPNITEKIQCSSSSMCDILSTLFFRLLMKCGHERLTVELKDGSVVEGVVTGADSSMNIHLKKVKLVAKDHTRTELDNMTVRGNTIRYVLLPSHLPLDYMLKDLDPKEKVAGEPAQSQKAPRAPQRRQGGPNPKVRRVERS